MEWEEMSEEQRLIDGPTHQYYCTLCGVPFSYYLETHLPKAGANQDDLVWVSYYLALRIPKRTVTGTVIGPYSGACISGVGQHDQQKARIPPPGYDIRDVLRGRPPMSKLRYLMNEEEKRQWEAFEKPYSPDFGTPDPVKSVYLMHPRCWEIFQQQHALLTSPDKTDLDLNDLAKIFLQIPLTSSGSGFRPDWVADYNGAEQFFWTSAEDNFSPAVAWHFLVRDPGMALGFDALLASPPLESVASLTPRINFADDGSDIFSRFPEEIITEILVLLPSASVRDLQLASRKVASVHLSSRYWRSRFEFPNELCHVNLPPALLRSGQVGDRWVDWRSLCDQLLHPVGNGFGWWQNRKRITALNRKLVESMALRGSDGRLREVSQ